jgi:hypothetical protein
MWIKANPNPKGKIATDCVIRAISICMNRGWYEVFDRLCKVARKDCDMPSNDGVWGHLLYICGMEPFLLPKCPTCITLREFCAMYPRGHYIVGTGNHAVAVIDGDYYDSWDSGNEILSFFWRVKGE